jgi:hypothetical protein
MYACHTSHITPQCSRRAPRLIAFGAFVAGFLVDVSNSEAQIPSPPHLDREIPHPNLANATDARFGYAFVTSDINLQAPSALDDLVIAAIHEDVVPAGSSTPLDKVGVCYAYVNASLAPLFSAPNQNQLLPTAPLRTNLQMGYLGLELAKPTAGPRTCCWRARSGDTSRRCRAERCSR